MEAQTEGRGEKVKYMVTSGFKITDKCSRNSPISLFSLNLGELESVVSDSRKEFCYSYVQQESVPKANCRK